MHRKQALLLATVLGAGMLATAGPASAAQADGCMSGCGCDYGCGYGYGYGYGAQGYGGYNFQGYRGGRLLPLNETIEYTSEVTLSSDLTEGENGKYAMGAAGEPINVTATVTCQSADQPDWAPGGTVDFLLDGTVVEAEVSVVDGVATATIPTDGLEPGTWHTIDANYSGDEWIGTEIDHVCAPSNGATNPITFFVPVGAVHPGPEPIPPYRPYRPGPGNVNNNTNNNHQHQSQRQSQSLTVVIGGQRIHIHVHGKTASVVTPSMPSAPSAPAAPSTPAAPVKVTG